MGKELKEPFVLEALYADIVLSDGDVRAALKRHRADWGGCAPYTEAWRQATGCPATSDGQLRALALVYRDRKDPCDHCGAWVCSEGTEYTCIYQA